MPIPIRRLMLLLPICFCSIASCSFIYTLTLDGIILNGPDRVPVSGARILITNPARYDESTAFTGIDGSFWLRREISHSFSRDAAGRRWYEPARYDEIIIEKDGQRFEVPCPSFPEPNSGTDCHATIIAVIDLAESEDDSRDDAEEKLQAAR
ncbi:MAG: hypothetical protein WEB58_04715 [Planctomycetaceae bacterium]